GGPASGDGSGGAAAADDEDVIDAEFDRS
ncbi:MAG: hypothetical protein JWR88_1901, partial [Pseudonocardia sp.]|nr:hypothetical protein [Pseudonocardia sp.]